MVTWNIHGSERPSTRSLAAALAPFDADILALQEVRWWQAHHLAWRLRMRVDWRRKHNPFSRFLFPLAEGAAILTPHRLGERSAEVISADFPPTTYRRRIAQWATVRRSDGSAIRVFNVHLSPESLRDDRRAEAHRVAAIVSAGSSETACVIAGDLNDADEPEVIEILPLTEHERPAATNPSDDPHQVLDHVLLPTDAVHERTDVPTTNSEWVERSDHLPVIVRFRLSDEPED